MPGDCIDMTCFNSICAKWVSLRCYKYVDNWAITWGCVFLKCPQLFSGAYGKNALLYTLAIRFEHMTCFARPNVRITSRWETFKVTVRLYHRFFLCVQVIVIFWMVPAPETWIHDQAGCPDNLWQWEINFCGFELLRLQVIMSRCITQWLWLWYTLSLQ